MLSNGVVRVVVKADFSSMLTGQHLRRHVLLEADASEHRLNACSWFE
jgi:hypothetical protein